MSRKKKQTVEKSQAADAAEHVPQGMLHWLWLSGVVVALDYVTKLITLNTMSLHERIEILPFFNFTRAHNTGAAFCFLACAGGWQRWMFAIFAFGFRVPLIFWLHITS